MLWCMTLVCDTCTLTIFKCDKAEALCVGTIFHSEGTHTAEVGVEWMKSSDSDRSCGRIEHQYSPSINFSEVDLVFPDDSIA